MKVLVCGGRDYSDWEKFCDVMDNLASRNRIERLIQGGASGADELARKWCVKWQYPYDHFPADWKANGKAAGPIRNQRMIDVGQPDLVVAFPGGRGTADMVKRAKAAGVSVLEVRP